jgi:AcrR family transcriptional regulator
MPESAVESRRSQILDAARICFLDRGFVNTTISQVIALSGGSRSTVYDEFGGKEGLFAAIVADCLARMKLAEISDGPPETVLRKLGLAYMAQLMEPEALALYRVVVGESAHVRQLGEAIFAAGPDAAAAALIERLRQWAEEGRIVLDNPARAARLFLAMAEGDLHRSALMWNRAPSDAEIAANVDAAVALFLAGTLPSPRTEAAISVS